MDISSDPPVRQRLKVVTLMDCVPGDADPVEGETEKEPITILLFSHLDEMEEPLMLSVADTETLMVKLLSSLAAHGDDFAEYLLDRYFADDDDAHAETEDIDDDME